MQVTKESGAGLLQLDHGVARNAWEVAISGWKTARSKAGGRPCMRWDHGLADPAQLNFALFGMGDSDLGYGMHFRCKSCHGQKYDNSPASWADSDYTEDDEDDSQEY